jgi:hypothetical protein
VGCLIVSFHGKLTPYRVYSSSAPLTGADVRVDVASASHRDTATKFLNLEGDGGADRASIRWPSPLGVDTRNNSLNADSEKYLDNF